jgi:2-keto-4-pentenoate hydratase/2-oxohepta-3-ene-1,7-dioic acid hydratase in catechol pathway
VKGGSRGASAIDGGRGVALIMPCRIMAQLTNYASHARDVGVEPSRVPLTFFRKASGSISGPRAEIVRPAHVRLLDYEVEIGVVIGRELPVGAPASDEELADSIAGFVLTNDVSARDIQLAKGQYYESKSYPTFTPVGPVLVLCTAEETGRFSELRLHPQVNKSRFSRPCSPRAPGRRPAPGSTRWPYPA